ncbi:MAG TPA: ZIP family metal transporter [Candidatus Nanoarchaeia archaeon]|nr:ZIP family metal transporter [Candidatus Nanoarchaeia archaeon]
MKKILSSIKKITLQQLWIIAIAATLGLILLFTKIKSINELFGLELSAIGSIWIYSIISVLIVSAVSLVGIISLGLNLQSLQKVMTFLVSLAAGTLLGDAMIHLLPEIVEESGFTLAISLYFISGVFIFFILEKFIHWQHCHVLPGKKHIHSFALMNLVGDGLHNFIDGIIIGGSYLVSLPLGIATTLTVIIHELPQEIGDFGVLIQGGFTKSRALMFNFLTALTAVAGTMIALIVGSAAPAFVSFIVPFTAGGFIYLAMADLIPELHKETKLSYSLMQIFGILVGILAMIFLTFLE